ncbi:hypothetical protein HanPI659440_Chr09g0327121 [Helianthus annuus]|nr:hypothetical protein HanPI659440_Chr09g0327121 [Helianthus annuus]
MNIITCLVLNRPYNVSKVIFKYLIENIRAGNNKYIMYPRFIQMMIDDQFKDIQKDDDDILGLRNMTPETISRLCKGPEPRVKGTICRISNPAYVAPENDKWRHEDNDSKNENDKMSELVEKKTRWWFVKDRKRKRTPKTSPVAFIPKEPAPKIVVKGIVKGGSLKEPQQILVDEPVLDALEVVQQGADLLKHSLESFLKRNEEVAAQEDQSASVQGESVKDKEPEGVVRDDSSEADSESTETEMELDLTTLGRGKAQLKKKPTKKQKGSGEEDSTYTPSVDERKKLRIKLKAVQTGVIPRNVRARKGGASVPESQAGKSEKHVASSKVLEAEKIQNVEVPKEPEVQSIPEVEVQKQAGVSNDYVEITGFKAATPPPPPPQDQPIPEAPESSGSKNKDFSNLFGDLPHATGVYKDDLGLDDDFDVFNNAAIKELQKKVDELEKEKVKAEAERDVLKKQVEELTKVNEEIKTVMIKQHEKLKKMKNGVHDNSQLFEILSAENVEMREKMKNLHEVNQTLNQLLSEINEASSNEMKAMKLEMEAMKADKVMKDEELTCYTLLWKGI